jgi:superfamily II DNA or RNA helicase
MSDRRSLYRHQQDTIAGARRSYARSRSARRPVRSVIQAPTAFGKTVVMGEMANNAINNARLNGRSACIGVLAPRKQLIGQTISQLEAAGIRPSDIGVIQADHPRVNAMASVQVCTPQTLRRRSVPPFTMVFVDECHEQHKFTRQLMQHPDMQEVPFFGFSATPWSKGMGADWSDLVVTSTTEELINTINPDTGKPFLCPVTVFAPKSGLKPDLSRIGTSIQKQGADYKVDQLSTEMRKDPLVADAVQTLLEKAKGRKTFTFCVDIAHAERVLKEYLAAGIKAEMIIGQTAMEERIDVRERFRTGETGCVINVGVLTTGCDWPEVDCIQILRPTKSAMLFVQIVGRGLRPSPGKVDCLVLDHSTNSQRLGYVTQIHQAHLCDGKPKTNGSKDKDKEALPKECPQCHMIKPPRTPICPSCGFEAKAVSKVVTKEGELVEFPGKTKKPPKHTMADKQRWLSEFMGYKQRYNKNLSWVKAKFRAKFGCWIPNGLEWIGIDPTPEVLGWIRHSNIAYAKSKRYGGQA